ERGMLSAEKARSAGASHIWHGDVGWQTVANPALVGNHRAERRMESHERPAGHRRRRRHPSHQIMVAAAVIRVLVVKRAHDGELVRHRRELENAIAEMHTK